MATARVVTEIVATMQTRVGLLADAAEALGAAGVNIMAVSGYERDGQAKFLFVTGDNAKAAEILRGMGASVAEKSVIAVEMDNRPGTLASAARKIADAGINVEYTYGTSGDAASAVVVFKTADDERAAELL